MHLRRKRWYTLVFGDREIKWGWMAAVMMCLLLGNVSTFYLLHFLCMVCVRFVVVNYMGSSYFMMGLNVLDSQTHIYIPYVPLTGALF